jgi:hypothetical protein
MHQKWSAEVLAAAQAESEAISRAHRVKWRDDMFVTRLAKFKAHEPWVEYLCDCTKTIPGEGP